jgi:hypothetical protein
MARLTVGRKKKREDYSAAFVVGAVMGGLAGALAVLWTTPKTGQEVREQLAGAVPSLGGPSTLEFGTAPASGATTPGAYQADAKPAGTASGEPPAEGIGHVASTEELVTPPSPEEQAKIRANAEAILNEQRPS